MFLENILKDLLFIFILSLVSCIAHSAQISSAKTVNRIFTEGSTGAGFYTAEGLPECKWGIMYIDLSKDAGKAMLANVLTAKTAAFKVVRIDYTVSGSGTCLASGLHIE